MLVPKQFKIANIVYMLGQKMDEPFQNLFEKMLNVIFVKFVKYVTTISCQHIPWFTRTKRCFTRYFEHTLFHKTELLGHVSYFCSYVFTYTNRS